MSVNPGAIGGQHRRDAGPAQQTSDSMQRLARAYLATYRGPHGDAPGADSAVTGPVDRVGSGRLVSPALVDAHYRLGQRRHLGDTLVAVYPEDDAGGIGRLQFGQRVLREE